MNHFLHRKKGPILKITKSLNQYPNIKAQTSEEIQSLNEYENRTVVFDDMLLSKQESNIELFFTRGRQRNINFYSKSQSYFHLSENTILFISNLNVLFEQTLSDIILLSHNIAGKDMNLEESKGVFVKHGKKIMIIYQYTDLIKQEMLGTLSKSVKKRLIQNPLLKRNVFC